jgi:hypothetical protein
VIGEASSDGRGSANGLMFSAKVVICEMEREGGFQVVPLLLKAFVRRVNLRMHILMVRF